MNFNMPTGDDLEQAIAQTVGAFFYDALSEEDKDKPATAESELGYRALASAIAAKLRTWNADGEVLTLTTREPEKWRFFDMQSGSVWQWQEGELAVVGMAMMAEVHVSPDPCPRDHAPGTPDHCACCCDDAED